LSTYYLRLLDANGVVAIEEVNWKHQHTIPFSRYALLGLPEEYTQAIPSGAGGGLVSPTMISLDRLDAPSDSEYPRFAGKLSERAVVKSVAGMSGGPIFGYADGPDRMRYWLVALQSSWEPDSRTIYGCPMPVLASIITAHVDEALRDIAEEQST
jgi:hypothetical protein